MGTIDHVMIRTMALKAGCYQDIHRLLILGNILRPPVTVVDLRRQSELRRHPGSDHPACLRSGRRASARGQSWFRLPSSCQNLTNTTDVVGTAIHAPRSVVYTAVLTDVGNVDSDNRQSKHCEQRDKSVCGVQHRLYCTCTWGRLYCWSLKNDYRNLITEIFTSVKQSMYGSTELLLTSSWRSDRLHRVWFLYVYYCSNIDEWCSVMKSIITLQLIVFSIITLHFL